MASGAPADIGFDRTHVGPAGELVSLTPLVRRMVAANPGPMTFTGTCTYVVGQGDVAIIDPGPDLPEHVAALMSALGQERVRSILVTHTHRDHSGAALRLKAATGAELIGCAPYVASAKPGFDDGEAAHDTTYRPEAVLAEGDSVPIGNTMLVCVATPGHTGNHLAFALAAENALFSGDHVMAWSTSVIVPPDGGMADYMASLAKLQRRDDAIYWPGHGAPVRDPKMYVDALIRHRRHREAMILAALGDGASGLPRLRERVYPGLDPTLHRAAQLSLRAHLDDLEERGKVHVELAATPAESLYRLS